MRGWRICCGTERKFAVVCYGKAGLEMGCCCGQWRALQAPGTVLRQVGPSRAGLSRASRGHMELHRSQWDSSTCFVKVHPN